MKFYSVATAALLLFALAGRAQPTAFTYQGQLMSSNAPANGVYDFQFQIYNAANSAVAGPLTNAPVGVTNGLFTVALDFGPGVFDGTTRSLEIGVRTNGDPNAYTILSPRQPLDSVPYAIQSINASNAVAAANLTAPLQATNMTGTISPANLPANVALLNGNQVFIGSNNFSGTVIATNATNIFAGAFTGIFSGNGIGQTNLSTTNLIGTLPDARLSTNVPLLNGSQIFSGANTFKGAVTATNPADIFVGAFTGNAFGATNLQATNLTGTVPDARLSTNVALQSDTSLNFAGSVTATNFIGAGHGLTNVPGAFFWVAVSSGVPAQPNVGYICENDTTPVTVTLPASPSVGDTFKVCGIGGAGWIIAQNAGQNIFSGNLSSSVGENWATNGPPKSWSAIASSADGTKLAAAVNGGYIYTATNSVPNWTQRATSQNWSCIASSADGTKLIAAVNSGNVYTSTDSGADWNNVLSGPVAWSCVACSANGGKLFAAYRGGSIWTNSGSGWGAAPGTSGYLWTAMASSSDGTKLVAVEANGWIFTSSNSGASWQARTNVGSGVNLDAVACSSDGTRMLTGENSGTIYMSTDSGATWILETPTPVTGQLTAVASSADGSRLAAVSGGSSGNIYFSSDSGSTWMQLSGAPAASWSDIACSADGSLLAATINSGNLYLSSQSSTTPGAPGYLSGAQHSAIELIYAGNGIFLPLNHEGTIRAY